MDHAEHGQRPADEAAGVAELERRRTATEGRGRDDREDADEAEDPERDIYLYINSPGGSVTAGMAIYDTMRYVRPDVQTVCLGQAASAAAVILAAGAITLAVPITAGSLVSQGVTAVYSTMATGTAQSAIARARASSLKAHKSSIEPPPPGNWTAGWRTSRPRNWRSRIRK